MFSLPTFLTIFISLTLVYSITPGFPYSTSKVRGVSLGGWLSLEAWITPSLFDNTGNPKIIDEWTFCQYQTKAVASAALKKHWDTFITEPDFAAIKAAGLNHVRIPIGYWAYDVSGGEPFIQGQLPYLQKAVTWAAKYNLKVIVDLHGAPGSQNGFDNSGQQTDNPAWHTNPKNIQRTSAIIKRMTETYKNNAGTVPIIAPLNEPAGYRSSALLNAARQFWYDSYGNIRWDSQGKETNIVSLIHDAFQSLSYWKDFQPYPQYEGVALDTHIYVMFSEAGNRMSQSEAISSFCSRGTGLAGSSLWTIVGEWAPVTNDCAKYLNGRSSGGARYDGTLPGSTRVGSCTGKTGKASTFSTSYKNYLRQLWEAQVTAYEKGEGWIMWTWKTELTDEWSYQAGLANGWIPRNPTERRYPNICG